MRTLKNVDIYQYILIVLVIFSTISGVMKNINIAVKVKDNCEKVDLTVKIASHRETAGKIMQSIHFWCTTDDFELNCSMRSSGRVYCWMPLFLNCFFVIINIEIWNKAFETFLSYCILHYVVHRQEIITYATIHVFSLFIWPQLIRTPIFSSSKRKIRAKAKHRLWKEIKAVNFFLIQVSVMSIENRMYLTQIY